MNKIKEKFSKFMYGRYGTDKLNMFLVIMLLVFVVGNLFVRNEYFSMVFTSWEFLLIFLIYYRMFSRNISKRYAENQKYLSIENRVRRFFGKSKYMQQQRKEFHIYTVCSVNRKSGYQEEREK